MGIRGLNLLLRGLGVLQDSSIHDTRLVVDGANLVHLIYFGSDLDQNHGGDYAAFEKLLESFVAALKACRISPYVVLDGCSDPSDKKRKTSNSRAENKIKTAHDAALSGGKQNILPRLAYMVLEQTMARLQVNLARCYGEADREIAALATEWRCPVLSSDSDFYIFQLPGGLLPIGDFQWNKVDLSDTRSSVRCKIYHNSRFCDSFNLSPELLPAFAVLAGNDVIKTNPFNWSQHAPSPSGQSGDLIGHHKGLLHWLRDFEQPDTALNEALKLLKQQNLLDRMTEAMMEYQVPASVIKDFFLNGEAPPLPDTQPGRIPAWMWLPLTQARLSPDVLDVLQFRRISFSFAVETEDRPSSNLTSRLLRQVMYGLLLGEGEHHVEEMDREHLALKSIPVTPTVKSATLRLASLHEADLSERLKVLLEALGVTKDSLEGVLPELRLPVAVTSYWLQKAQPPPNEVLLKALIEGMMGAETAGIDFLFAAVRARHETPSGQEAAYALNQWQSCLRDALQLNQLLNFPLEEPRVARLFEGTAIHRRLTAANI